METMKDIKARFASAKEGEYNALFQHYENDERSGVQKLIQQYRKKLQALENERARTEIMKEYEEIYKEYYDDYMFIYNYGALLHLRGEYKKSLEVLNAGKKYLSDYNMMLLIGDDYQKLKQYDLAIASYKRAGEMIPSRYLPLYYRMELYLETGDMEKAYEIANMIINKKNKIKESKLNQQIINKAKECLNY